MKNLEEIDLYKIDLEKFLKKISTKYEKKSLKEYDILMKNK